MAYEKFVGKWALAETDNFDKYLGEIGIGWTQRTAAKVIKPVLTFEVSNEGNHWKFTSVRLFIINKLNQLINVLCLRSVPSRLMQPRYVFANRGIIGFL